MPAPFPDFLQRHRDVSEQALLDALIEEVLAFSDGIRPRDDMTVLLLERGR